MRLRGGKKMRYDLGWLVEQRKEKSVGASFFSPLPRRKRAGSRSNDKDFLALG
jgi:hypothetical protein